MPQLAFLLIMLYLKFFHFLLVIAQNKYSIYLNHLSESPLSFTLYKFVKRFVQTERRWTHPELSDVSPVLAFQPSSPVLCVLRYVMPSPLNAATTLNDV